MPRAALARTQGPSGPDLRPDQARLDARAREATRTVEGFSKLKVRQKRAVKTIQNAVDRLNGQLESYRLSVDAFKVTIGMPVDERLVIEIDEVGVPTPEVDMEQAA